MNYHTLETEKGILSITEFAPGQAIQSYSEFFDALMSAPSNTVVVPRDKITETFFELSSGLAGDILQKVSNYRKRLVILGDFTAVSSKSLSAFIFESNRTGQVVFAKTVEDALVLLK